MLRLRSTIEPNYVHSIFFFIFFSGVSQDLNEVIMTIVNNASVILAKARQQPPPAVPPTTPQPPVSNPTAMTPNPLSGAGGALNVGPPGPSSNAMPPISNPGLGVSASGMPPISTPNMGINTIASNFGNIGGGAGPIGGVGPIGRVGPIGGGPGSIGGGPLGGAAGPIAGGSGQLEEHPSALPVVQLEEESEQLVELLVLDQLVVQRAVLEA